MNAKRKQQQRNWDSQSITHTHAYTHVQRHDYGVKWTINATHSPSLSSAATSVCWVAAKTRTSRTLLPERSSATWPDVERRSCCRVSFWRPDGKNSATSSLRAPPPTSQCRAGGESFFCAGTSLSCDPTGETPS